jgi:hypothetical protein
MAASLRAVPFLWHLPRAVRVPVLGLLGALTAPRLPAAQDSPEPEAPAPLALAGAAGHGGLGPQPQAPGQW